MYFSATEVMQIYSPLQKKIQFTLKSPLKNQWEYVGFLRRMAIHKESASEVWISEFELQYLAQSANCRVLEL